MIDQVNPLLLLGRALKAVQARNFIYQNIIEPTDENKSIQKNLVQTILKITPIKKLKQSDQFCKFIKRNGQLLIQQLSLLYDKSTKFKLTRFGQFCASQKQRGKDKQGSSYGLFSDHFIAYLKLGLNGYQGFCYRIGVSAYVGEFDNMKSHGNGIALFLQQKKNQNGQLNKIYNQYRGQWKQGEIINGIRKTYINQVKYDRPLFEYKGKFANFQFNDQAGIIIQQNKQFVLNFQKGRLIKPKKSQEEEQKNQQIKKSKLTQSNLQKSTRSAKKQERKSEIAGAANTANRPTKELRDLKFY